MLHCQGPVNADVLLRLLRKLDVQTFLLENGLDKLRKFPDSDLSRRINSFTSVISSAIKLKT